MGKLPVPVLISTSRPLFTPGKRLGCQVAWWLEITKYIKKNHGVLPILVRQNQGILGETARLPGSVMTSNYQIWKKHGILPILVHRNQGILMSLIYDKFAYICSRACSVSKYRWTGKMHTHLSHRKLTGLTAAVTVYIFYHHMILTIMWAHVYCPVIRRQITCIQQTQWKL